MKTKSIKISNFQSLGNVDLEIKDLTVLCGPSDTGKSSFIRAIKSLHRNTIPSTPIRYGATKLRVTQEFEDGQVVSFEKGKTTNSYTVGEKTLAKVGRDVPDDVRELLKTDKLVLDKDQDLDLNFSGQFDSTFLLTASTSVVTKTISSLSGIHYIYSALREATTQVQRLKSQNQLLEANIEGLKKYDELANQSFSLSQDLTVVDLMDSKIEADEENISVLGTLLQKHIDLINKEVNPFKVSCEIVGVQDAFYSLRNDEMEIDELQELLSSISAKKLDITVELEGLVKTINILNSILLNVEKEETGYNELMNVWNAANKWEESSAEVHFNMADLVKEELEIKSKIKVCDTCKRVL